jgi:transcriptional regulator GlxA family with amidase domain
VLVRVRAHISTKQRLRSLEAAAAQRALHGAGTRANPEEEIFIKTVSVLEARMADPPGLIELARSLGTNERKLTQIFRRKVGMTVFDYLTELRLDTARRLLEGSAMQIQLIADRVGYSNAGDFTRAFRRRFEVSPREYRKALGGGDEETP